MGLKDEALRVGIDVGSTTVKAVVLDSENQEILYSEYLRHGAKQALHAAQALQRVRDAFPNRSFIVAITGSGAAPLAKAAGLPYVQEVVANSLAVRKYYPQSQTAIELGGQDAKMIFFQKDREKGTSSVRDMRMNGSCAGGTGAFIDEIASVLRIGIEDFNALASAGRTVYDVSGRCGVYAKTDIQPLLNQGVPKADIALSAFHAIAKQCIGGLAQGMDINKPVVFEGGPLTFNPKLIDVFKERLGLADEDAIVPKHPETIVALGAALSLDALFAEDAERTGLSAEIQALLEQQGKGESEYLESKPFFESEDEFESFKLYHPLPKLIHPSVASNEPLRCYIGIDCGSTTTKFVLVNEAGDPIDSFYASNEGQPVEVAKRSLLDLGRRYAENGIALDILGVGTTGYGEMLLYEGFKADYHVVETVAHAKAACHYKPSTTFILDIGGQDMKAIWLTKGIVTDIVVNEACSSGCGSFLENFAMSLGIPTNEIAAHAFASKSPAVLGSRCTVFMNSSIVSEQRRGKDPNDIMAGLCRSIVENVFTKVIRVSNLDRLGNNIVVQGGTFLNDAVLRAFEEYVGRTVSRAPYPGLMGAIGVALLTMEHMKELDLQQRKLVNSSFIGLDALAQLEYRQQANLYCPYCANHCNRSMVSFSNGSRFVTGNRCPRGEVVGDPKDDQVKNRVLEAGKRMAQVPNLFEERKELLFKDYPVKPLCRERDICIGLPRVLMLWDMAPFWTSFWRSLGFKVKLSPYSTRKIYEQGLQAVPSDTVCFPAKLVHGHIRSLVQMGVDRIFMPSITVVEPEGSEDTAESMCPVVKGYPIVIRNSDNPEKQWGVPFDAPLWHWYTEKDKRDQLQAYMKETFDIPYRLTLKAIEAGNAAMGDFRLALQSRAQQILQDCQTRGSYAVVLASRPYQNDDLVNHDLPNMFTEQGIPVLTADSLAGIHTEVLRYSRIDIANNYHARMLSTALIAARRECLEYVQIVSFGCGHDAYLSDEIIRLMNEVSGDSPLILKLDESDIYGPLRIRVRSFIETVNARRALGLKRRISPLSDPYPVKFKYRDKHSSTVLCCNTSHAFSLLMTAATRRIGINTVSLPVGGEEAIRLGKKYVHNDICFPCQMVIGEILEALQSGKYDTRNCCVFMAKYVGDCRLTHYTALLRKALDDAGYSNVAILTNDDVDYHDLHPAFKLNLSAAVNAAYGLPMIDALEELLRKMRPYELIPGSCDAAFEKALQITVDGLEHGGLEGMKKGFTQAIQIMKCVKYDRSKPKPQVLIVGEYLLNFHPGANHNIERYLEANGLEIIEARMTDVIRKSYFYRDSQVREYKLHKPISYKTLMYIQSQAFVQAHSVCDSIACAHPLYQPATRMEELVQGSDDLIHHTFDAGEGVLIAGEIIHHAEHGCKGFVILQPFGCLPNHIVGRGIAKKLKEMYPDTHILSLDYDPDVSFANVENRLQMLVMDLKAKG